MIDALVSELLPGEIDHLLGNLDPMPLPSVPLRLLEKESAGTPHVQDPSLAAQMPLDLAKEAAPVVVRILQAR